MDASEENQLRIYDLTEEKKKLKLQIDEEQYMNLSLHRRRSMFSASIIKNIVIFLYFLFLYLGMKFLANIMDIGEAVKDNPVVKKLLELSDPALGLIEGALLLVLATAVPGRPTFVGGDCCIFKAGCADRYILARFLLCEYIKYTTYYG